MTRLWKLMRNIVYPGVLFALLWATLFEAPKTEISSWPSPIFYLVLFLVAYHSALYIESEEAFKALNKYTIKSFVRDIFDICILLLAFSSLEFLIPNFISIPTLKASLSLCFIIPVIFRGVRQGKAWIFLDALAILSFVAVLSSFFGLSLTYLSIILWVLFSMYIGFIIWRCYTKKLSYARI